MQDNLDKHTMSLTQQENEKKTRVWASAQRDGHSSDYRWCPLFNAQSLADADY